MDNKGVLIREGFFFGLKKGWRSFLWMMKFIIPISFCTMLLSASGLLNHLYFIFEPLMELLSLPPMAALPLLIGMITGIYGGIAAMVVLPFTVGQMTLLAIFLLIAHNLIQEGIIQAKSGVNPVQATLVRLAAAVVTVMAVAPFLRDNVSVPLALNPPTVMPSLQTMLLDWAAATSYLVLKIFIIIMIIITLLEILKKIGFIHYTVRYFSPLLKIMGLTDKVGFIWITALIFGLVYGAAVILEEINEGALTKEEILALQLSIGIQHSVIEDPLLLIALGIGAFWIYVPRLIIAILTVRLVQGWHLFRRKRQSQAT